MIKVEALLFWLNACQPGSLISCVIDNNKVYLVAKKRNNAGITEVKIGEICQQKPVA